MDTQTVITLLTVTVVLLSVVIVAFIAAAVVLLVKLKKISKNVDRITDNIAQASVWLTPSKVFGAVAKAFRK